MRFPLGRRDRPQNPSAKAEEMSFAVGSHCGGQKKGRESRGLRETGAGKSEESHVLRTPVKIVEPNAEVGATANKRRMKITESGEDRLGRNGSSSLYSIFMGSTNEGGEDDSPNGYKREREKEGGREGRGKSNSAQKRPTRTREKVKRIDVRDCDHPFPWTQSRSRRGIFNRNDSLAVSPDRLGQPILRGPVQSPRSAG